MSFDHRLTYYRISRRAPIVVGMILYDFNDYGDKLAQKIRTIPDLRAIHLAVPGRAAMNELVSQNVQPCRDDG